MNFLEAFNELNQLTEATLTEKLWVAINPNGSQNYYKFLTVNDKNKQATDIANMVEPRSGTYKQMLDKKVFKNLVADLTQANLTTKANNIADPKNYSLHDPAMIDDSKIKVLTLGDRYLRQAAHSDFNNILNKEENKELAIALKDAIGEQKYLIHHIDGNEAKNTLDNVVLIPYESANKDNLKIANGIHGVLHGTNTNISKNIPITKSVFIFYFENGKLRVGKCNIEITL